MINIFRRKNKQITVGVEISNDCISLLALDVTAPDKHVIKKYLSHELGGEHSLESMTHTVKQTINECELKGASCCYVLSEKDYELFLLESPNVPNNEVVEAVRWKVKDLISYPVEEAVVDVFFQPDSGSKKMIYAVVAKKELVEQKMALVNRLGLDLVAVDIPELSYRNLIEHTEYVDKTIALVVIKSGSGKLVVLNKGGVSFSRGFPLAYNGGLLDSIPENDLTLELQRSLDYCERQLKQDVPAMIFIVGENITEDKITDVIKQGFNQKITTDCFDFSDILDEEELLSHTLISTYGAALRKGMTA